MSEINKTNLTKAFDEAIQKGDNLFYILVEAEGIREAILIPRESFEAKKEFYQRAYTEELTHAMNSSVFIGGYGSFNTNVFDGIL